MALRVNLPMKPAGRAVRLACTVCSAISTVLDPLSAAEVTACVVPTARVSATTATKAPIAALCVQRIRAFLVRVTVCAAAVFALVSLATGESPVKTSVPVGPLHRAMNMALATPRPAPAPVTTVTEALPVKASAPVERSIPVSITVLVSTAPHATATLTRRWATTVVQRAHSALWVGLGAHAVSLARRTAGSLGPRSACASQATRATAAV